MRGYGLSPWPSPSILTHAATVRFGKGGAQSSVAPEKRAERPIPAATSRTLPWNRTGHSATLPGVNGSHAIGGGAEAEPQPAISHSTTLATKGKH